MKYLGYAIIALSFTAGFLNYAPMLILLCAFLSTLVFASARRKTLKETPMQQEQNMILDGMFLFALQAMIMFVAYLLGIFAASAGGDSFLMFLSGER
jgi:uncharacterized membrane protein